MAINPANWSTKKTIQIDDSKVSGSSNLTDYPALIKDGNIPDEVYDALQNGEISQSGLFSDANLISYYDLEGNSTDQVGSNDGTDNNITYSSGNGYFGQGAGFNGTNSYIALGTNTNLNGTAAGFSVHARFKSSNVSTTGRIASRGT